jgi:hypothetical protein
VTLLAPLFLLGLIGLAVPVLIHLTQREKKTIQHFPSLMFIRRIPYQSVRRRAIRHWLLLCLRLAALALIVLAFTRPFLDSPAVTAGAGEGAREVVIVLDQSYSMGFATRWAEAQAAARDVVAGLDTFDRASVVLFAEGAEIQIRSTGEQDRLAAAIDAAAPTDFATHYAPALNVAASILTESTLPRREVVLISDFQRSGWRGEDGAGLPAGATLTPVPVTGGAGDANLSVVSVSLASSTFEGQERATVTANVVNRSMADVTGSTLTLEVNGRPLQSERVDAAAGDIAAVTFQPFTLTGTNVRGVVRLADDGLLADNVFRFVSSPARPVRILLIERGGAGNDDLYLERALAIGEAPRFEATVRGAGNVSDDDLLTASVVVLHDAQVNVNLARRLARFVEDGGGLLVAAGPGFGWPADAEADVLPGTVQGMVDRTRGAAGRIGALEFAHPVFEVFRAPRSGDFSSVQVYGYRTVDAGADGRVLARFETGSPALLERQAGAGRVLLWASALDLNWSDLPLKPVFLPFVHRAVRHLAAYVEPRPWLTVGEALDVSSRAGAAPAGARVAVTPGGARVPVDEESAVLGLAEQGFYEILAEDALPNAAPLTVVASNVEQAESDLAPMDPEEVVAATMAAVGPGGAVADLAPLTPEAQEQRQRLWWYLLVAGLLLLGAETLLANRLSKA